MYGFFSASGPYLRRVLYHFRIHLAGVKWIFEDYRHNIVIVYFQNFYLIDPHLVAFIVTIIFRKLLLSLSLAVLRGLLAPKLMPHATIAAR